jgi:hypothetical protein
MKMNQNTEKTENNEPQPWQLLDQVVRKWVTMSGFHKDQDEYSRRAKIIDEMYD